MILFEKQFEKTRGYSSVVEHSTADREVPGSNPGAPYQYFDKFMYSTFILLLKIIKFDRFVV